MDPDHIAMTRPFHPVLALLAALAWIVLAGCGSTPDGYDRTLATWKRMEAERAAPSPEPERIDEAASLQELLRWARRNNPGLEAAFQRWKQALERIPQVQALPEPRLTFGAFLAEIETRVGPQQARLGLVQPFPWFGKLGLAGEIAYQQAEAAGVMIESVLLDLEQNVRDAWYEYAWLEEALAITGAHRELLSNWESVARARLETGIGTHSDVIRAQVELGKLEDRLATLDDLRSPIEARLNAALDRPAAAALPRPETPLPEPPSIDEARLRRELREANPHLRALGYRVEAARKSIDLARKDFYPDFLVGVDYVFVGSADNPAVPGSGDDAVALVLGLDLPLWRPAYRAGVRGAEAGLRAAQSELDQAANRLSADLEMSLYRWRDADRRVGLFRDSLIPKGEESVEALTTAYQSGDEGFLDLIDAERVLLEFQLEAARARSDRAQALAETERITGIPLHQEP